MLNEPMMEKLFAMRLTGMSEALKTQEQDPAAAELSFHERLAMLVDQQWSWRENQALGRRLKTAKLRGNACMEEIDYRVSRGLDKSVIRALTQESAWARASRHPRWPRKRVAMATRCFTPEHNRCFAIWDWRGRMAACGISWPNSSGPM